MRSSDGDRNRIHNKSRLPALDDESVVKALSALIRGPCVRMPIMIRFFQDPANLRQSVTPGISTPKPVAVH